MQSGCKKIRKLNLRNKPPYLMRKEKNRPMLNNLKLFFYSLVLIVGMTACAAPKPAVEDTEDVEEEATEELEDTEDVVEEAAEDTEEEAVEEATTEETKTEKSAEDSASKTKTEESTDSMTEAAAGQ